jgi:hypothetical protein
MLTTHRLALRQRVDATRRAPRPGRLWQLPGGLGRAETPPVGRAQTMTAPCWSCTLQITPPRSEVDSECVLRLYVYLVGFSRTRHRARRLFHAIPTLASRSLATPRPGADHAWCSPSARTGLFEGCSNSRRSSRVSMPSLRCIGRWRPRIVRPEMDRARHAQDHLPLY